MSVNLDRRDFLKAAAAAATTAPGPAAKAPAQPETLAATLYHSLTPEQRGHVCFPFDDPLRSKVDANWFIVPKKVGELFTADQQKMIEEIFRGLHNPEFFDKVMYHIREDSGSLANYSVALFGEPSGKGKQNRFEFVLTGRHCTIRADGDSVEGAAFGGPIMYGHQAGKNGLEPASHPNNVYWYQAQRANEVFQALDSKQRETALIKTAPRAEAKSKTVEFRSKESLVGLPVADMTKDQRQLVEKVLADLLLPFRLKDRKEARSYIDAAGGVSSLWMSFYKNLDIGNDGVWDVWQLESPNMVWYFRGYPHVHTWVNIKA